MGPVKPSQPPPGANDTNVRMVENHIVVDVPLEKVFNFMATWSNLAKWLPMTESVKTLSGKDGVPMEVGDVLYESVKGNYGGPPKIYTCRAKVDGALIALAGTDEGDDWVRWVAHFTSTPLTPTKTIFTRVFQQVCKDVNEERNSVTDPDACQGAVERFKAAVEAEP